MGEISQDQRPSFGAAVADAAKITAKNGVGVTEGAYIGKIRPGSMAEKMGLAAGDIITEVNRQRISNAGDLIKVIGRLHKGSRVSIAFVRGNKRFINEGEVTIGERQPRPAGPPAMQIDTSKIYFALIETTLGAFKIQLFASESPRAVNNFVFLSQKGFYNGVIFHRVIKDFMIQTGDPTGTGAGGPGYTFADELPPRHRYEPGIVAMANSGYNTNGSQFFICTGSEAEGLNSQPVYTQLGKVIEGMDVVLKIAAVPVGSGNPGEDSRPVNPPAINRITITSQ